MTNTTWETIPEELRRVRRWLLWKPEPDGEKVKKVPYSAKTGFKCNPTNPESWATFHQAATRYATEPHRWGGIGLAMSAEDNLNGIDLDDSIDPVTKAPLPWARVVINRFGSYTEVSPGSKGTRIFVRGKLPWAGKNLKPVEVYSDAHYLTVTGASLNGYSEVIENQPALDWLVENLELIALAGKISQGKHGEQMRRLFNGDPTSYKSQSEADLGLCKDLARLVGPDPDKLDFLFRLSGLMRSKWDEKHSSDGKTYGQLTVEKALSAPGKKPAGAQPEDTNSAELAEQLLSEAVDHDKWVHSAPELEELWEGLLFRGCVHLLAAPPKKGKSTFLTHLLDHLAGPEIIEITVGEQTFRLVDGTFLGRKFKGRQRILLVTENPPQFWHIRPPIPGVKVLSAFRVRAAGTQAIPALIRSGKFDLVVIDSFDKALPLRDENSNAELTELVGPIVEAAHETGVAVILVHHHRKGGGSGGEEIRGGSGLFGAVDEYLSLTRLDGDGDDDDEGSSPMLMSLKPSGRLSLPKRVYFTCTLSDAWVGETPKEIPAEKRIIGALREADEPLTRKQIQETTGVAESTVKAALKKLIEAGKVKASGGKTPRYDLAG